MSLEPGASLDHYRIIDKIGEGGMGQVFRAEDTRLQREVAIKVLPGSLAEEPERRQRFEQEARTVSQLKHPHICVLFDIGRANGTDYLVMELLEGETLTERLARGPMPLREALRAAAQIAEALGEAHRQGVVHRDLKPGNVMLTRAGAKLLDFGLAKLATGESSFLDAGTSDADAATRVAPLTSEGTILGTVQYMSPEQLEGRPADARSDIFAFGALLHEMIAGAPAFQGESKASLVTAIMGSDPAPLRDTRDDVPPLLQRIIETCLAKDPERRFQSAQDLARDLKWIAEGGDSGSGMAIAAAVPRASRSLAPLLVAGALGAALALLGGFLIWGRADAPSGAARVVRSTLPLGERVAQGRGRRPPVAISPLGSHIVYVAPLGNSTQLKLRRVDQFETVALANTEGAQGPFFSPDGQWIGYFADRTLYRVPVGGGMPTQILAADDVRGAVWLPDDSIIYTPTFFEGLWRVPSTGGTPTRLTTPDASRSEKSHRWPHYVPGANLVLYTIGTTEISSFDEAPIGVLSLDTGQSKVLASGGASPRVTSTGHLVYGRNGSLFAAAFDVQRLELLGAPSPVLEGVSTSPTYGTAAYDVNALGDLVYVPGSGLLGNGVLVWVDRQGQVVPVTTERRDFLQMAIGPDGRHVSLELGGANDAVWTYDLERDVMTRLTFVGDVTGAVWSPDGGRLAFAVPQRLQASEGDPAHEGRGDNAVYWVAADGSGNQSLLTASQYTQTPTSWSPDGRHLLLLESNPDTNDDILVLPVNADGAPGELTAFARTRFRERHGTFSPDGRWVAYASDESGRHEVYVRSFPDGARKVQISQTGGLQPRWRRDGRELFFRRGDQMLVVTLDLRSGISAGTPRVLFEAAMQGEAYDVAPDGQRFLMVQVTEVASPDRLDLVQGWANELSERLPAR